MADSRGPSRPSARARVTRWPRLVFRSPARIPDACVRCSPGGTDAVEKRSMGMAAIARRSGARVRRRRLAACAVSVVMAAALAVPGGAPATPPTPVVTATQAGPLQAQLTSSTGTQWSWTFLDPASAVVGMSMLQNPLQEFPRAGDYTAI